MYIYWQQDGGQEAWHCAMLRDRDQIIKAKQPRFTTVLAVNRSVESVERAELDQLKYLGPFYADFDAADAALSIKHFNRFLDKFQEAGADLNTLSIYATGGRGFHIEMPLETFLPKPPKDGLANLPAIYKEMAYKVIVNSLDMRVYSAKRGRMWRTTNVQRENGTYKVPISLEEARAMTPDLYAELCKAPRQYGVDVPKPQPPALSVDLAVVFSTASDTIAAAMKKRKKGKKDLDLIAKFKGKIPATLTSIMSNIGLREDAGWNQIAMQVAISMNALGKSEDEIVELSRELINNHSGDSARYATPALREEELRQQIAYTADNPCYDFSVGAIKSLLASDVPTPDLEGITNEAQAADYVEAQEIIQGEEGDVEHTGGLTVGKSGIRVKTEEGWKILSMVGMAKVRRLVDPKTGSVVAFDADIYYRNTRHSRQVISLDAFSSRAKLNGFCTAITSGTFIGTDIHASFVQEWLGLMAKKESDGNPDDFIMRREGLDIMYVSGLIKVPDAARDPFPVLVSPVGCVAPPHIEELGLRFRFAGTTNEQGLHKTDIMTAPALENTPQTVEALRALLNMNKDNIIAGCIGWICAAHARMFYQHHTGQFPLLAISGQAGSGKSATVKMLMRFHYYRQQFKTNQATGSSYYAISENVVASASIPTLIDEYKPSTMAPVLVGQLRAMFRGAYDNGAFQKGGGDASRPLTSGREIMERTMSSPIIFIGENPETETAIQERSIFALFNKEALETRSAQHKIAKDNMDVYSAVGKQLIGLLLQANFKQFAQTFDEDYDVALARIGNGSNYRVVHNYAVIRHGLRLFQATLHSVGITELDERIEELRAETIEIPMKEGGPLQQGKAVSECSKVLSTMAVMSRLPDRAGGEPPLKENHDYAFSSDGDLDFLEISIPFVYAKYEVWQRERNKPPLYVDEDAFLISLNTMLVYDRDPKVLTSAPGVVRLRLDKLVKEKVSPFKQRGR